MLFGRVSHPVPLPFNIPHRGPTTLWQHAAKVWAVPFSLATTWGIIIIFFSSRYLDVSVLGVGSLSSNTPSVYWVVPFGNLRI